MTEKENKAGYKECPYCWRQIEDYLEVCPYCGKEIKMDMEEKKSILKRLFRR